MKRFKFSLEKVLKLREFSEQEARIELGKAIGLLSAIENNLTHNALIRSQAAQERFAGINAAGAVSLWSWDHYINRLEQEAERLMQEAAQAETVVEEKRNLYLEASRELKVMEKLKEKRKEEYRKEAGKA